MIPKVFFNLSDRPVYSFYVLKATAIYYQQLDMYLYIHHFDLAVVSPICIKRFIKMKLQQNKTDKI